LVHADLINPPLKRLAPHTIAPIRSGSDDVVIRPVPGVLLDPAAIDIQLESGRKRDVACRICGNVVFFLANAYPQRRVEMGKAIVLEG
jgi:hypothetical protein